MRKTYILKKFSNENYDSVVYFNFESDPKLSSYFSDELNPRRLVRDLSLLANKPIHEGRTLIFFDEVQSVPRVLTSLKYFYEDASGYHVACAGSLPGFLTSRPQSFPVGKVDRLRMYPMDFEEFLMANDEHGLVEFIRTRGKSHAVPDRFRNDPMIRILGRVCHRIGGCPKDSKFLRYDCSYYIPGH